MKSLAGLQKALPAQSPGDREPGTQFTRSSLHEPEGVEVMLAGGWPDRPGQQIPALFLYSKKA